MTPPPRTHDPFERGELLQLTADLPGTGGTVVELEDFQVEEIPAYLPCGEGEHCMALVEKQGLTTPQAVERLCGASGASSQDAGYAGLKDKHGITRQWVSLAGVEPARLLAIQQPDLRVLSAALHRNKLRTGHLKGNRFCVVLRGVVPDAHARAGAILARLAAEGLPNYYGDQRFGSQGDNARRGLALLVGGAGGRKGRRSRQDKFKHRLFISALQSHLFNVVLRRRLEQGALRRLLGGEVLQPRGSSGLFVSEDAALDGPRLAAGEVVVTGPICGPRMPWPKEGSPAWRLEREVFDEHELDPEQFAALGRLARGGRRPLTVEIHGVTAEPTPAGPEPALRLSFDLPPGSYATVLLGEVAKQDIRLRSGPPVATDAPERST